MSDIVIEEETGTTNRVAHRNNGYWAGAFTTPLSPAKLDQWFAWGNSQANQSAPRPNRAA